MNYEQFDPETGRLLAVGDIHGCLEKLRQLLEDMVRPSADDRVVFLGDYIDRGPDSKGVIEYLLGFQQRFPKSIFLRGNHEQMFLDAMVVATTGVAALDKYRLIDMMNRCFHTAGCRHRQTDDMPADEFFENCRACDQPAGVFLENGGDMMLRSYAPESPATSDCFHGELVPQSHLSFLQATSLLHFEQIYGQLYLFTHAGYNPDIPLTFQDDRDLLWMREIDADNLPDDLILIHGHTPSRWVASQCYGEEMYHPKEIRLDSGVCYPEKEGMGKLSCCDLLTRSFWQV